MTRKSRSKRPACPETNALSTQLGETIARLRKALKIAREERDVLKKAAIFFAEQSK